MTQEKIRGAKTAYDLARLLLAERGIHTADQAYAHCPEMPPRTVRRIFERGADQRDSDSSSEADGSLRSLPLGTIELLTEKAREAKVSLRSAVTAVLRFGNPVERVTRVLDDIVTLGRVHKPAFRPTGLFIRKMRDGTDVQLPDLVHDQREAQKPAHPPLTVGEWVRWCGEWMRVMSVKGLQAFLSPSADELDLYKINCDLLLHLPRRSAAP